MSDDKPILMSAPMVRAILDGRKTQTRRIIKPQPEKMPDDVQPRMSWSNGYWWSFHKGKSMIEVPEMCGLGPYGRKGTFLWVRETTKADHETSDSIVLGKYAADDAPVLYPGPEKDKDGEDDYGGKAAHWNYSRNVCPGIHMPRRFSRLTLEIKEIKVERLHEISEKDALAEGLIKLPASGRVVLNKGDQYLGSAWFTAKAAYEWLWNSINGENAWARNPWVWAITFETYKTNIDDLIAGRAKSSYPPEERDMMKGGMY